MYTHSRPEVHHSLSRDDFSGKMTLATALLANILQDFTILKRNTNMQCIMSPISLSSLCYTLSTIYTVVGRVSDKKWAWMSGFLQLELCSLLTSSLENFHFQGMVSELPMSPFQAGEWESGTVFWVLFHMRVFLTKSHIEMYSHVWSAMLPDPRFGCGLWGFSTKGQMPRWISTSLIQFLIQAMGSWARCL